MEGNLVRLRAYEKSDLDAAMKLINDEEITDLLGGEMLAYPVSSIAEEKFIEAAAVLSDKQKTFVIETLAEPRYIGTISFNAINWLNRSAGVGIVIGDKSLWGKGYGTDAMRVMMRLGFDKMNLHRLWLHVHDYNLRAIASYEKCGFKREGVLRQEHFKRGRYHDTIVMGILESEYRAIP
ncbi:GNAT family N-acetyltransferase [Candidatus Binatus sp.]|uniref:GNAT family N-acetyltransferase n=1 Tax=Candidatus Binatus sp. TaxID=2811406 RepID=UPI003F98F5E2